MPLSHVLNDAGSLALNQHFEDKLAVCGIICELEKFTMSVRLVV
jgi:hypothetical protein